MNHYIREQIKSMLTVTESFQSYCRAAALHDAGRLDRAEEKPLQRIDRAEEKTLQRIDRASDRFMKDLKKTLEDSEKGSESTMDRKEE